jgi:Phage integrase, N-terminal SAM-like domain
MQSAPSPELDRLYQTHLKHLTLKGLQPKTIDAYARAIRRAGDYFDHQIETLTEAPLTDYFTDLLASHSWSAVKLDLYGLKFFYTHVLRKPWVAPNLGKPPKGQRLPDIVTVEEAQRLFQATQVSGRYRRRARSGAHPGCQGQQGPSGAPAHGNAGRAAPLLAVAPPPHAAVSQPPRGPEGRRPRPHAPGPRWRSTDPT